MEKSEINDKVNLLFHKWADSYKDWLSGRGDKDMDTYKRLL